MVSSLGHARRIVCVGVLIKFVVENFHTEFYKEPAGGVTPKARFTAYEKY